MKAHNINIIKKKQRVQNRTEQIKHKKEQHTNESVAMVVVQDFSQQTVNSFCCLVNLSLFFFGMLNEMKKSEEKKEERIFDRSTKHSRTKI